MPLPLNVKFVYVPPITVCALVLAYSIVPPQVPAGKDNGVADVAVGHVVLILPLLDNVVVTDKVLLPIANVPPDVVVNAVEIERAVPNVRLVFEFNVKFPNTLVVPGVVVFINIVEFVPPVYTTLDVELPVRAPLPANALTVKVPPFKIKYIFALVTVSVPPTVTAADALNVFVLEVFDNVRLLNVKPVNIVCPPVKDANVTVPP